MRRPPPSAADLAGMQEALGEARAAADRGAVPVGAVLVRGGKVIARAANAVTDPLGHAELVALREALRVTGSDRLLDSTLYITLEPCAMCAGAIVLAKVGRVVFGAWEPKTGMAGSVGDILRQPALNHHAEVLGGVMEAECAGLLEEFFRCRR